MANDTEQIRVYMPRHGEVIGQIDESLGGSRFKIACQDGHTRVCRMPGKFRRRMKIRPGDYAVVKPWDIEPKEKGDIVFIYTRTQAGVLKKRGLVK
ncbi:MAG: translation initiation factor IF-1A [Nanoarchaeota archaeon]|nr:translation initiation factor IF-1A [Nanoarchaeota archaeon]